MFPTVFKEGKQQNKNMSESGSLLVPFRKPQTSAVALMITRG